MRKLLLSVNLFLNPLGRLGKKRYTILFPLLANIVLSILSEVYALFIAKNPAVVGNYIIFLNVLFLIYFSFRDGIIGGFITSLVAIFYYAYVINFHHYSASQAVSGYDTTIILGALYILIAIVIGLLKQTIDDLIEKGANQTQRLQQILQQLPVGVIVTDSKGVVEQTNAKVESIIGKYIPKGVIAGKDIMLDIKQKNEEFVINSADKKKIYINVSATPIRNKSGTIIATVSIVNDITFEKEQEERKDNFINMASHELKTPLTSVLVFAQILQKRLKGNADTEIVIFVDKMIQQLGKMTDLVRELLDVTQMNKGSLPIHKESFLVKELVKEVIESLQHTTPHTLVMDWHTKIPVFADKERIRQVLINLVTNAIKYSSKDKDIIISSEKKEHIIQISVKDFGLGLTKDEQKRIFERFYQVNDYTTYPGLGLGLFISKQIIDQHQGKMWVESIKGKGSTFYFSLPIKQVSS